MKFVVVMFMLCFATPLAKNKNNVHLAEQLTSFVSYLKTAALESALAGDGPFTVFGPSNAAFKRLPAAVKNRLSKDKNLLKKVLMVHIAIGKAYLGELSNNQMVQSLDPSLMIRVNIYQKDSMNVVTVDGAKVVMADQNATNGVIHVIDKVMFPLPSEDIPKTVAANKNLTTLLHAVAQGQLATPLAGSGPFTLFAPNNAAFDKLPPGALNDLLSNQTALVDVLKYHVVVACDYSAGLSSGFVQTLQGQSVKIVVSADGVTIDNAKVVMADIPATNGVIHEIDTVLMPPK